MTQDDQINQNELEAEGTFTEKADSQFIIDLTHIARKVGCKVECATLERENFININANLTGDLVSIDKAKGHLRTIISRITGATMVEGAIIAKTTGSASKVAHFEFKIPKSFIIEA